VHVYIVFGVESCETDIAKNSEKTSYVGLRSFKVVEFVSNRNGICNLLLVVNSNLDRILGLGARANYWSNIACVWDLIVSFNAVARGDSLRIFYERYIAKTKHIAQSNNEKGNIVRLFVLTQ